ncbi:MAG: DNA glycosylase [Archangium gephyra]|uniref:DNA-(apurinic or apyrimidinic site) lyase n=1 Tax=Archangium gephyra TaxID=48 RepID=A0A2W5VCC1_9BACT|nr:MAG: DNA glycosylase [Archangium gephyra]
MPEGHTLHRLALDHRRLFAGDVVRVSSPQGRFAAGAAQLDGEVLLGVEAWGKHLLYEFESSVVLHVHLGLFGRFRRHAQPAAPPRGAVRMRMENETAYVDLHGPTACELLDAAQRQSLLARIGPDLLRADASKNDAWQRIKASRRAIGALLLDQSVVSGVGNVFRAEGLFVAGIHPETPGRELDAPQFTRLWKVLVGMLRAGVRDRKIITVKSSRADTPSRRARRTWVYKQQLCERCQEAITCWELGNRVIYACENCQRR